MWLDPRPPTPMKPMPMVSLAPRTRPRATRGAAPSRLKAAVAFAVAWKKSRRFMVTAGMLLVFILSPECPRALCLRQPKIQAGDDCSNHHGMGAQPSGLVITHIYFALA